MCALLALLTTIGRTLLCDLVDFVGDRTKVLHGLLPNYHAYLHLHTAPSPTPTSHCPRFFVRTVHTCSASYVWIQKKRGAGPFASQSPFGAFPASVHPTGQSKFRSLEFEYKYVHYTHQFQLLMRA